MRRQRFRPSILDRLDPLLPLSPGRAETTRIRILPVTWTLSLYAALDTATGHIHVKTAARHTSQDFVALLKQVVALFPSRQQIHIILDNLSAHEIALVRESWSWMPVFGSCRAVLKSENFEYAVRLLHLIRRRAQAPCT
jgi:DDE superfamily endonuclease